MKHSDFELLLKNEEVKYKDYVRLAYQFQGLDFERSGFYYGTFADHDTHRKGILVSDYPGDLKTAQYFDYTGDDQKHFILKSILGPKAYERKVLAENSIHPLKVPSEGDLEQISDCVPEKDQANGSPEQNSSGEVQDKSSLEVVSAQK